MQLGKLQIIQFEPIDLDNSRIKPLFTLMITINFIHLFDYFIYYLNIQTQSQQIFHQIVSKLELQLQILLDHLSSLKLTFSQKNIEDEDFDEKIKHLMIKSIKNMCHQIKNSKQMHINIQEQNRSIDLFMTKRQTTIKLINQACALQLNYYYVKYCKRGFPVQSIIFKEGVIKSLNLKRNGKLPKDFPVDQRKRNFKDCLFQLLTNILQKKLFYSFDKCSNDIKNLQQVQKC
ncbi:unnamed protein product (macronuclear) [Paramecium tetraurelia]|uniref:Transmembrane protein n=1 Tax=Paramecium tetraurelia TaxID=5888 RepID=A0C1W4_PARTE|nr:uncharacterized protein GSPATT00034258001 [Paramecium tetraurelia]CAK64781.1 unnamed protein product [Paramecium tetraurelia]|eukprot:XP_001432178.1 hypothetical protein (macronuclear) [Paramecium tetraurelia strain d4-2]